MKIPSSVIAISLPLVLYCSHGAIAFSGEGAGSEASPYVITDVTQLQEMNLDLSAHYVLGNDIDASETVNWNEGAGFEPIGRSSNGFIGLLDGRRQIVRNLFINRPMEDDVGLFGNTGLFIEATRATIRNVGLENCNVTGGSAVGGLVGNNRRGDILRCFSSGNTAGDSSVGGLVGLNGGYLGPSCTISRCFSSCTVNGQSEVGGLVGWNSRHSASSADIVNSFSGGAVSGKDKVGGLVGAFGSSNLSGGSIESCYSFGKVAASNSGVIGGLVGFVGGAGFPLIVSNCYWDIEASGQSTSAGGWGLNTDRMFQQETFREWDFYTVWQIEEGIDYPRLSAFSVTYSISTIAEMQNMQFDLDGDYVLVGDVNATETSLWNDGKGFLPIGSPLDFPFRGTFDGLGNSISGLVINDASKSSVGLFGFIRDATIQNLFLNEIEVIGNGYVGGLIGQCKDCTVRRCRTDGTIVGGMGGVGGLVGEVSIQSVFSAGSIVENSYSGGLVMGLRGIGGLVGYNAGSVLMSYSSARVSGNESVGGLVGLTSGDGKVSQCYWDTDTSSQSTSSGGEGRTTIEMYQRDTYEGWDFGSVWWIDEGNDYPHLYSEPGAPPTPRPTFANPASDINLDNKVDELDLLILLEDWHKVSGS